MIASSITSTAKEIFIKMKINVSVLVFDERKSTMKVINRCKDNKSLEFGIQNSKTAFNNSHPIRIASYNGLKKMRITKTSASLAVLLYNLVVLCYKVYEILIVPGVQRLSMET